jgi:hypothetical protein
MNRKTFLVFTVFLAAGVVFCISGICCYQEKKSPPFKIRTKAKGLEYGNGIRMPIICDFMYNLRISWQTMTIDCNGDAYIFYRLEKDFPWMAICAIKNEWERGWSKPVVLTKKPELIYGLPFPGILSDGKLVCIFETQGENRDYDLNYSEFLGDSWLSPIEIDCASEMEPYEVLIHNNKIMVFVISASRLYYIEGKDGVWSPPEYVDYSFFFWIGYDKLSAVLDNNGNPNVIYEYLDEVNDKYYLYHTKRENGSWSIPEEAINMENSSIVFHGEAAANNRGEIFLIWDVVTGNSVYFSCYSGNSWSIPETLPCIGCGQEPDIAVDVDGNPVAVWADDTMDNSADACQVYMSKYIDDEWTEPVNVSECPNGACYPQIEIDCFGNRHLLWYSTYEETERTIKYVYVYRKITP